MVRAVAVCQPRPRGEPGTLDLRRWALDGVYEGAHAAAELHDDYVDELVQGLLEGRSASIVGVGQGGAAPRALGGFVEPVLDRLGLLPRATELTLARLQQHGAKAGWLTKLRVGCFEIGEDEVVTDLLNPEHKPLVLRGRPNGGAIVEGLTEVYIRSRQECSELRLVRREAAARETAASRSHIVTTVGLEPEGGSRSASRICFVSLGTDLRGSSIAAVSAVTTLLEAGLAGAEPLLAVAVVGLTGSARDAAHDAAALDYVVRIRGGDLGSQMPKHLDRRAEAGSGSFASRREPQPPPGSYQKEAWQLQPEPEPQPQPEPEPELKPSQVPASDDDESSSISGKNDDATKAWLQQRHDDIVGVSKALQLASSNEQRLKSRVESLEQAHSMDAKRIRKLEKENRLLRQRQLAVNDANRASGRCGVTVATTGVRDTPAEARRRAAAAEAECDKLLDRVKCQQHELKDFKLYKAVMEQTVEEQQAMLAVKDDAKAEERRRRIQAEKALAATRCELEAARRLRPSSPSSKRIDLKQPARQPHQHERVSFQQEGCRELERGDSQTLVKAEGCGVSAKKLAALRQKLKAHSYGVHGQNPQKLLKHFDRDNTGELDFNEFRSAVRKGGHMTANHISDRELRRLFDSLDQDGSGDVGLEELTAFVWGAQITRTSTQSSQHVFSPIHREEPQAQPEQELGFEASQRVSVPNQRQVQSLTKSESEPEPEPEPELQSEPEHSDTQLLLAQLTAEKRRVVALETQLAEMRAAWHKRTESPPAGGIIRPSGAETDPQSQQVATRHDSHLGPSAANEPAAMRPESVRCAPQQVESAKQDERDEMAAIWQAALQQQEREWAIRVAAAEEGTQRVLSTAKASVAELKNELAASAETLQQSEARAQSLQASLAEVNEEMRALHVLLDESEAQNLAAADEGHGEVRQVMDVIARFSQRHQIPATAPLNASSEVGQVAQQVEAMLYRAMAYARGAANDARLSLERLRNSQTGAKATHTLDNDVEHRHRPEPERRAQLRQRAEAESQRVTEEENDAALKIQTVLRGNLGRRRLNQLRSSSASSHASAGHEQPPPESPMGRRQTDSDVQVDRKHPHVTFSGARTSSGNAIGELGLITTVPSADVAPQVASGPVDASEASQRSSLGLRPEQHHHHHHHHHQNQPQLHNQQQHKEAAIKLRHAQETESAENLPPGIRIGHTESSSSEEGDAVAMTTFGNTTPSPFRPNLSLQPQDEDLDVVRKLEPQSPRPPKSLAAMRASSKLVDEAHSQYELVFCMLLGIQTIVNAGRESTMVGETPVARSWHGTGAGAVLVEGDYEEKTVVNFPPQGSTFSTPPTPAHEYGEFKFKTYAPKAFRAIRKACSIAESDYLASLCDAPASKGDARHDGTAGSPMQIHQQQQQQQQQQVSQKKFVLREVTTNSKSNSFFFYSHDIRFLVKTISIDEKRQMLSMLSSYTGHVADQPGSFLARILGMYKVRKHVFIVQLNVFACRRPVHEVYDLKGSSYKRRATEREKQAAFVVLKDIDFKSDPNRAIKLEPDSRNWFLSQLNSDIRLLETNRIIGYSVLLGIHFRDRDASEPEGAAGRLQVVTETPRARHIGTESQNLASLRSSTSSRSLQMATSADPGSVLQRSNSVSVTGRDQMRGELDGAVPSADPNEVYYIGVIDLLVPYSRKKQLEAKTRGRIVNARHGADSLSVTDPKKYASRLLEFVGANTPEEGSAARMLSASGSQRSMRSSFGSSSSRQPR